MLIVSIQVKDKDYFPVVVVANKCDLDYERQVDTQGMCFSPYLARTRLIVFHLTEGNNLAKQFGAVCIETSAKQRINVDEVFMELVRAIRRYNKVRRPPSLLPYSADLGHTCRRRHIRRRTERWHRQHPVEP